MFMFFCADEFSNLADLVASSHNNKKSKGK